MTGAWRWTILRRVTVPVQMELGGPTMSRRLAEEMLDLRQLLQAKGVIFNYNGFITEEILTGVAKALRTKLELDGADKGKSRRLFAIFIEQVQNIIRYSAEYQGKDTPESRVDLRYGLISIGETSGMHFVSCCNLIAPADAERLRESLNHIQRLTAEELKNLYKETLRGETPEGSKGAGVGFIEIARQASSGFEFDFRELDGDRTFFCIRAYV